MRLRLPSGWFGRLLLLVASTLLAVVLVELGLRWFLPQNVVRWPPQIWQRDPELWMRFGSGLDLEINTGERTVRFQTDERGYRVGPDHAARAAGRQDRRQVLLIGDSFLAGLQVEHDELLSTRLEEGVSRLFGEPVEMVNSGTGGWDPNHYRILAERELPTEDYDAAVVFLYTGNDIVSQRMIPGEYVPPAEPPPPPTLHRRLFVRLYRINVDLQRSSHAFVLFKERTQFLRIRLGLSSHYFPLTLLREHAESPSWDVTAAICREIADLAERHETPILFVLLPGVHQVDREMSEPFRKAFGIAPEAVDIDQPSRRLAEAFADVGLELVDLTPGMRAIYEADGTAMYGLIDTHFSVDGHRVVAELIEERVAGMLVRVEDEAEAAADG